MSLLLEHFHTVQAIKARHGSLSLPASLATTSDFATVLKCLGYAPESPDPWHTVGMSPLEGPDFSLSLLESRVRLARILGSAIGKADWAAAENGPQSR